MRSIGVVTVARSDYGVYLPLLRAITADPEVQLQLFVSGAHLSERFGKTGEAIEADGFPVTERIEMLLPSDTPEAVAESMGRGTAGFARAFARTRPDLLVILGDRFEMHAAAAAAVPFNIPMAHIGGGEITEGAIDDSLRHSLTKLSHLHFVYTKEYARRLERMGEEPWRITVCSAPNLDNARLFRLLSAKELEQAFPFRLSQPLLLVTFHPVTRELDRTQWQVSELMAALEASDLAVVITAPNADPGNQVIRESAARWVAGRPNAWMVENLGPRAYFSMMALAAAMIGNSSSGIVEAASFKLPTVNIGTRQQGRARAKNIIDVGYSRQEILSGIRRAVSPEFRDSLRGLSNPYGEGEGAPKILSVLKQTELGDRLLRKRFYEPGDGR